MIIISDYTLILKEDSGIFVESSENSHLCPVCQGTLRYRDSRPRIRKKEGGVKERLMIRKFRCQNCRTYHNELPDCLVPYKHYEAEVIAGVLDKVVLPDDLDSEDVFCKHFLHKVAKTFCRCLQLHFVGDCSVMAGSKPAI